MIRPPRQHRRTPREPLPGAPAPRGEERALLGRCEALLRELRAFGVPLLWAHIPDVPLQHGTAGRQQARRKGLPDLLVAQPAMGLVLAAECKTECGKLTFEQAAWLAAFGNRGAVVRSENDLLALLKRNGVVR